MATKKSTTKKGSSPAAEQLTKAEAKLYVEMATEPKKVARKKQPSKAQKKLDINECITRMYDEGEEELGGKIAMIINLYAKGYSRPEIVAAGYNRSTVYRQTKEFDKLRKAPAMEFHGHDLYEARIQRVMKAKKFDRDAAAEYIAAKDLED